MNILQDANLNYWKIEIDLNGNLFCVLRSTQLIVERGSRKTVSPLESALSSI